MTPVGNGVPAEDVSVFPGALRDSYEGAEESVRLPVEEIARNGFAILHGALSLEECDLLRDCVNGVYQEEIQELGGIDAMEKIGDVGVSRSPFLRNEAFLKPITLPPVLDISRYFFGRAFQMNLQRVVMNMPSKKHGAAVWHRDFSYQDFTTSKPLSLTSLVMLDGSGPHNGGVMILPGSHMFEGFPSDEYVRRHAVPVECEPGDVVLADSACYHRGGFNMGDQIRHVVVTIYTVPVIRQNVDYPTLLDGKYSDDPTLRMLFGYDTKLPSSDLDYRQQKLEKNKQIAVDRAT